MEAAYAAEGWYEFYLFAGGAAAVLMGLVFIGLAGFAHLMPPAQKISVLHK